MVITVIRVATPIVSPSMVSDARNLCARRALRHSAKLSRTASMARKFLPLLYRILWARTADSLAGALRTRLTRCRNESLENTTEGTPKLHPLAFYWVSIVHFHV